MAQFEWKTDTASSIKIGDLTLETMCFGPPPDEAMTIVMLHEGLGCVELWRDFPQTLSENTGFGVFVYSRAGYGQSDPCDLPRPMDYMTQEALEVLPEVISQIGLRKGVLLGHSDGATIASIYAGSVEDFRIRGLVLMAPHFFTEEFGLAAIAEAKKSFSEGDFRDKLAKYHKNVDAAFLGWNDAWLNPDFRDWNVSEAIDYLRVPVLAIQGVDDTYGTSAQIDEIESRAYSPVDVVWLEECGHAPHLEQAKQTTKAVVDYVSRLDRIEKEQVATLRSKAS